MVFFAAFMFDQGSKGGLVNMTASWSARAAFATLCAVSAASSSALAQVPSLTDLNIFRDNRGVNDVGIDQGDVLQGGADVQGGSASTTIQGIFTSNTGTGSFTTSTRICNPLVVDANFCARSGGFNTARLNGIWQAKFTNASGSTTVTLPDVSVIPPTPVPFPTDVTIATDAQGTPTISWTIAPGTVVNSLRVNIHDKSLKTSRGAANIIESTNINPTQRSYKPMVALQTGGSYSINLQIIQTRDGQPIPAGGGNADILSRSSSFFSFSKPAGSTPVTQLPQVQANGVYNFHVGSVSPNSTTFIDPAIAIGYTYAVGPGDPNFASVTLPSTGGGHFTVTYQQGSQSVSNAANAGVQFNFPGGGVATFKVTGIDPAAALDPSNAGAFVTGLTFVSAGTFTGTMTPIESGNTLFAATLPASRSIQVGSTATAFATILNNAGVAATGCGIVPATLIPADFLFQTTDPTTNALTGTSNKNVSIPAGMSQSFLIAFTANSPMTSTNVALGFGCVSSDIVPTIVGVNSLLMTFDANPVPDMIAVGLTPTNDGFSHTGGASGTGVFAIASANIGATGQLTARARLSDPTLPAVATVCQTNPSSGQCMATPAATVSATVAQNQNSTWAAFIQASGTIASDPAANRVFFEFLDQGGIVRGSTSTAITTQ
jgi:hypothetical protein